MTASTIFSVEQELFRDTVDARLTRLDGALDVLRQRGDRSRLPCPVARAVPQEAGEQA